MNLTTLATIGLTAVLAVLGYYVAKLWFAREWREDYPVIFRVLVTLSLLYPVGKLLGIYTVGPWWARGYLADYTLVPLAAGFYYMTRPGTRKSCVAAILQGAIFYLLSLQFEIVQMFAGKFDPWDVLAYSVSFVLVCGVFLYIRHNMPPDPVYSR